MSTSFWIFHLKIHTDYVYIICTEKSTTTICNDACVSWRHTVWPVASLADQALDGGTLINEMKEDPIDYASLPRISTHASGSPSCLDTPGGRNVGSTPAQWQPNLRGGWAAIGPALVVGFMGNLEHVWIA